MESNINAWKKMERSEMEQSMEQNGIGRQEKPIYCKRYSFDLIKIMIYTLYWLQIKITLHLHLKEWKGALTGNETEWVLTCIMGRNEGKNGMDFAWDPSNVYTYTILIKI